MNGPNAPEVVGNIVCTVNYRQVIPGGGNTSWATGARYPQVGERLVTAALVRRILSGALSPHRPLNAAELALVETGDARVTVLGSQPGRVAGMADSGMKVGEANEPMRAPSAANMEGMPSTVQVFQTGEAPIAVNPSTPLPAGTTMKAPSLDEAVPADVPQEAPLTVEDLDAPAPTPKQKKK
jgi:hypothetical protein